MALMLHVASPFLYFDFIVTLPAYLCLELLGEIIAVMTPLVGVDGFLINNWQWPDHLYHLEVPNVEGDVGHRAECQHVVLARRHLHVGHFGLRQGDDRHHGFTTQEDNLVSFDDDQIGAFGAPLDGLFRNTFKCDKFLIRLAILCTSLVELIDDHVLLARIEVLLALYIKDWCS